MEDQLAQFIDMIIKLYDNFCESQETPVKREASEKFGLEIT